MAEPTITRPDGRTYRPRRRELRVKAWESDDEQGVIVLGTLDADAARPSAQDWCDYWFGEGAAAHPDPDWWRDGYQRSERTWVRDERRGTPGVMFTWTSSSPRSGRRSADDE